MNKKDSDGYLQYFSAWDSVWWKYLIDLFEGDDVTRLDAKY